ncbi:MAG: hypothetical protein RL172_126 [Bacteroidota bacterium]|jgi:predicted short-subunit dehydrogenase-like oxidoreductase (DUF2520 family)
MRVVIIGAGNVAHVLGSFIKQSAHQVVQVVSRSNASAMELAAQLGCKGTADFAQMLPDADIYLTAISDAALNTLSEKINPGNQLIVHTAGAVPKNILQQVSSNYGVLYPLQSLSKNNIHTGIPIPLLIDASNEQSLELIKQLAQSISDMVQQVNDADRLKLHLAAVVTNNFTNHLYALTHKFCADENLDFNMLLPLIEETTQRLHNHAPAGMQTGPAIRNDTATLDKHLRLLARHPDLRNVYLKLTDSIINSK